MNTLTYKQLFQFRAAAVAYLNETKKEVKLKSYLEKALKDTQEFIEQYNNKLGDIELDHAATDKDGCVLYKQTPNGREYKFTKEGIKGRDGAIKSLFEVGTVEVEPHICNQLPKDLHDDFKTFFKGFVI